MRRICNVLGSLRHPAAAAGLKVGVYLLVFFPFIPPDKVIDLFWWLR